MRILQACDRLSLLERREIEGPKKHLLTPAAGSAESCTLQLWQGMEHGEVQSSLLFLSGHALTAAGKLGFVRFA